MSRLKFDVEKFFNDRKIDQHDISAAMADNADQIGFYGYQESLWKNLCEQLKLQIDTTSSEVELEIRSEGEKITENTIKAKIAVNDEVRKYKRNLVLAREQEMLYSNAVRTMEQRGKMLISLGAWMRAEAENLDLHTNGRNVSPDKPRMGKARLRELTDKAISGFKE